MRLRLSIATVETCSLTQWPLFIAIASVINPAIGMVIAPRVAVGPVDNASLFIPFVFAFEADFLAFAQVFDVRRKVNVVADEDSMGRAEANNEALVAGADVVVGQQAFDGANAFYDQV